MPTAFPPWQLSQSLKLCNLTISSPLHPWYQPQPLALYHPKDERGRKALTWWYTDGGEVTKVGQKEVTPWESIF